ncbi:MarR family winged helix-turn-helix transcriptional regulator [Micromonospora chersina]|uniref:MarR family winged helix-turn-helix transcriptional regulator n=1 Tax=Micromonospora chersina TaxID=47854 RepID=UPI00371388A1
MTQDGGLDDRQQRAWRSFYRMQEVLRARLEQQLQATSGMSNADYTVLVVLYDAPGQRLRQFELGEVVQWEKSRLHHQLSRMCQRGLVERGPDPRAPRSRARYVTLTPAGRQALLAAAPAHSREVKRLVIDRLTDDELDQLGALSTRILDALDAAKPSDGS